ncbi:hypothetical protein C8R45DRAFT_120146 [Mycena sanguinolenta]|nr:hypothetical protein C8R45DRAFT_120146 [Mycena sanguinolenta]
MRAAIDRITPISGKLRRARSTTSLYTAVLAIRAPRPPATSLTGKVLRLTSSITAHGELVFHIARSREQEGLITVFAWARRSSSTRACRLRATHQRASPPRDRFADGLHLAPVTRFPPTSMPPRGTMLTKVNTFLSAFSKSNTPFSKSDTTCLGMPESRVTG